MPFDQNSFEIIPPKKRKKLILEVENFLNYRFKELNWWTESQIAMLQEIYYLRSKLNDKVNEERSGQNKKPD